MIRWYQSPHIKPFVVQLYETAEIVSINPLIPQSWGTKSGGYPIWIIRSSRMMTPDPQIPAGSILHLFFSGLTRVSPIYLNEISTA